MIRLTSKFTSAAWYVNPDHIVSFGRDDDGDTVIELSTDNTAGVVRYVAETPAEVARKVLEWRLAMERYRAVVFAEARLTGEEAKMLAWARDVERRIMLNLAGLEEPT